MKLKRGRYRAVTQVKGMSAEITNMSEADTVHLVAGNTFIIARARLCLTDGVYDHGEILKGIDVNLGEPRYSLKEYAATSFNERGAANGIWAV